LAHWPGPLFDDTRDYLNWGIAASADTFPSDVMQYSGADLIRLTLQMTPTWSPKLRELFTLGDPSTTFAINIRTSVPIPAWTSTNVTLLGDAIHTMTPGRGVGANTALRDAQRLVEQLTLVRDGRKGLIEGVQDYETKMIEYGFKAVTDSREQMTGDAPIHKPVLGRAVLAGMRTYLRLVDRVPMLKRKMIDGLYEYRGAEY
jgi:2-polyprenyl-6-methoxyphenol hydroxylase-like FAD-dependent oxidoreductase